MRASHILVPVDFSAGALRALAEAVDLSRALGARLEALFVVESARFADTALFGRSKPLQLLLDHQRQVASSRLQALARTYAAKNVALQGSIEQGRPGETICDVARRRRSDMIVMATHGTAGRFQAFLGSVTEYVVRTAPCPVMTVHTYVPPSKAGPGGKR